MPNSGLDRFVSRRDWLDRPAGFTQTVVGGVYGVLGPPGRLLKDLAHGTKLLGHPLHPALTDIPIGAWVVGLVLDLLARNSSSIPPSAGTVALLIGTIAAVAAALTGYTDFHETFGLERRVAFLHGITMTTVTVLQVISLVMRAGGEVPGAAVALTAIAVALTCLGGWLGGHVVFGFGTMVNRNAFDHAPTDFVDVAASDEVAEGALKAVDAKGTSVLLARRGGRVCAIAATCSHAGGPLAEGKFEGTVVTCPWHGSRFDVCSGKVKQGPATFAQTQFDVSEEGGRISVRAASPQ